MARNKMTLQQIADLCGVSIATVSRVINNSDKVSPAVAERVNALINQEGYEKKNKNIKIPLTLSKVTIISSNNIMIPTSYYAEVLDGLRQEAERLSIKLELIMKNELHREEQTLLNESQGIVLLGIAEEDILQRIYELKKPTVLINGIDPKMRISSISPDYELGGFLVANRLLELGHKKFKIVTANFKHTFYQRSDGFTRALHIAGVEFCPNTDIIDLKQLVSAKKQQAPSSIVSPSSLDFGASEVLPSLIGAGEFDDCSAIFCVSDSVALSLITLLKDHGIKVPEDISVVGFDNLHIASVTTPPLSTVKSDFITMAQKAIHMIIRQSSSNKTAVTRASLAVEYVDRASTTAIN